MVCIFCEISKGRVYTNFIYQNRNFFSIPDSNPQVEGHSLVISKKHFDGFLDLKAKLGEDLVDCIKNTGLILMRKLDASGFKLSNTSFNDFRPHIDHFHVHIFPEKEEDSSSFNVRF